MNIIHKAMQKLHHPHLASLFIRLGIGIVFIHAGWLKLADMDATVAGFAMFGIPAFLAYVVAYTEFIGGILVVLGIYTRFAALLLAFIMLVAMIKVHLPNGYGLANNGYEYVLLLMLVALGLATMGAGKYSLPGLFGKK